MKTNKLISALILIAATTFGASAFGANFQTVSRQLEMRVRNAETTSMALDRQQYIKNIVVQAEGVGTDSIIEVMVNGNLKGTIYAPGADPSYLVTIEERAQSIEFRHRYGGTMRIIAISATVSEDGVRPAPRQPSRPASSAQELAERVIQIVNELTPYANLEEQEIFLIPIKVNAGQLKVMVEAHGFYSKQTRDALERLQNRLQSSDEYLMHLMEVGAMFDTAVELLTVKEKIRDLLK